MQHKKKYVQHRHGQTTKNRNQEQVRRYQTKKPDQLARVPAKPRDNNQEIRREASITDPKDHIKEKGTSPEQCPEQE